MLVKTLPRGAAPITISVGADVHLRFWWHNGQIKVGIDAPRSLPITEKEQIPGQANAPE